MATLEEQALGPIENPIEMGHKLADLVKELEAIPGYKERFQAVFGTGVTSDGIAKAIAAFERTVLSGNSPYDRLVKNKDESALTEEQKRGMDVFMENCSICHSPPIFTNGQFVNAGIGMMLKNPAASTRPDRRGAAPVAPLTSAWPEYRRCRTRPRPRPRPSAC